MLPAVEDDGETTARKIALNCFALLGISLLPAWMGLTGPAYSAIALILGAGFMFYGLQFFLKRTVLAARRLFLASILYMPLLLVTLVLSKILIS